MRYNHHHNHHHLSSHHHHYYRNHQQQHDHNHHHNHQPQHRFMALSSPLLILYPSCSLFKGVRVAVAGAPATVTAIPFATRRFDAESESPAVAAARGPEGEDAASMAERLDEAK